MTAVLAIGIGFLYAVGVYLLLQRTLTHVVMGLALVSHGANILLLMMGGRAGRAPVLGEEGGPATVFADPLPQALALTAIVISFGVTTFLLVLAWRGWVASGTDKVEDDLEDRRVANLTAGSEQGLDESAEEDR